MMRTTGGCRPVTVAGAVALLALLAAGEAAAQGPNQGPVFTSGSCSYSLTPAMAEEFAAAGGTGRFSVSWTWTAPPPGICIFNCSSQACGTTGGYHALDTWITIDNGQTNTGTHPATIAYTVGENTGARRRGIVSFGVTSDNPVTHTVTQAAPCPSSPNSVSPTSRRSPAGGERFDVSVDGRADCTWDVHNVSDDRTWISVNPTRVAGGRTVRVTVAPNDGDERRGTVAVGTGTGRPTVAVTQDAAPCPPAPVSARTINVGHGGGTVEEGGTAGGHCGPYTVTVSTDDGEDWLHAGPSSIAGNGRVTIRVAENFGDERRGTVAIGTASIRIIQAAAPCPPAPNPLVPSSRRSPYEGETYGVTVHGPENCTWEVSGDQDWIMASPSTVSDDGRVTIRVKPNSGPGRLGTVSIGERIFRIAQCQSLPNSVRPSRVDAVHAGGDYSVTANGRSDCSWAVSDDQDWIMVSPIRVPGGDTVTVTVKPNDGAERSGTVSIGERSVSVTQCPSAPVSSSTMDVGHGGDAFDVGGTAGGHCGPYSVTVSTDDGEDWLGAGPSSIAGNGTVTITVAENFGDERRGTVAIGTASIRIEQDAARCPASPDSVSPTSRRSPYGGERFGVAASNERPDCTFSVSSNKDWIDPRASSVVGGGTVNIDVEANPGAERSGTVSIGGRSVSITQDAAPCPASPNSVDPTDRQSPYQGETFDVDVSNERPDCSFPVSSNRSWIPVGASSVDGGRTVRITVDPNPGGQRSGAVTIGDASVQITQADDCTAAGSTASLSFGKAAGSKDATAGGSSACTFAVSADRAWIAVSASSVAGGGTVSVSVEANSGPARSGTVTIGDASVAITQADGCSAAGSTASLSFGNGSSKKSATAGGSSACTFAVSADRTWITVGASSVAGGGTVRVLVTANSGAERTGAVTIGTSRVAVTQRAAACPAAPGVNPAAVTFGADGAGAGGVAVGGSGHCGYDVEVSSGAAAWLNVDVTRVSGGETVTLSATVNTGGERTGAVTVGTRRVAVTQRAAACPAAPDVNPAAVTFGADGTGAGGVAVGGSDHCGYDVEVSSGAAAWLNVDVTRASGGDTVTLSATANSGAERRGTVTIGAASVQITQANGCPASPGGVPVRLDYGSGAASRAVTLTEDAGCPYAVTKDADWITIEPASAAGNGTVTVTVAEHTGTAARTGTVTIGLQLVSVTQTGGCQAAPGVTAPLVAFGNGGGMLPVGVGESSVCEYAVTADPAWVTVQPARVTGGGTVTVTVPEDLSGGGPRRGTVTIGAAGVRVAQGNTPPVAAADAVTTWRETATPVAVLGNDTDADGDPLAVAAVVTAPAQGTAAVSADGQTVTYTSAAGWAGDETFTYQVTDDVGGTAEATVTVTVRAAAPFTDPVLTVGVTPVKAVHMTELRTRADAVRVGCGLTAAPWTDPVLTAKVTPIKAVHTTELRAAVTAAYAACARTAPAWTDPVLTVGVTPIKAVHMTELREAVIALE